MAVNEKPLTRVCRRAGPRNLSGQPGGESSKAMVKLVSRSFDDESESLVREERKRVLWNEHFAGRPTLEREPARETAEGRPLRFGVRKTDEDHEGIVTPPRGEDKTLRGVTLPQVGVMMMVGKSVPGEPLRRQERFELCDSNLWSPLPRSGGEGEKPSPRHHRYFRNRGNSELANRMIR